MYPLDTSHRKLVTCAISAFLCVAGLGVLALETGTPFLFPSLGATTFLMVTAPASSVAAPRNAFFSHVAGAAAGWACYHAFGLHQLGATIVSGGGAEHVIAAALALAITCVVMLAWRIQHPPAGATTLIAALGFLPHWWQIPMVGGSVLLLTLEVRLIQRLGGERFPWWRAEVEPASASLSGLREAA